MKLIIDIPEDSYERVMNPDKFYRDIDGEKIRWAVYKGTPIPDNATNGDVIKALFPKDPFSEEQTVYLGLEPIKHMAYTPNSEPQNIHFQTMFINEDWWNAPYQKGGKE